MNIIKKIKYVLMIIFVITLIAGAKVYAVTGIVNENVVYIRKSATTDSNILSYVTKEDKVDVIEKDGDWYKIKYKGITGYIYSRYINVDESKVEPAKVETTPSTETVTEEANTLPAVLHIDEKTDIKIIPNIVASTIYTTESTKEITIIVQLGSWSYIKVEDTTGWVRTDKIKENNALKSDEEEKEEIVENEEQPEEQEEKETAKAYIAYDMVNLREEPSTSSKSLAKLKLNDEVSVIKEENSTWTKVKYEDITGYISTSLLSKNKVEKKEDSSSQSSSTSRSGEDSSRKIAEEIQKEEKKESEEKAKESNSNSSKVTGQAIADYAQQFLGKPYVSAGTSPSTGFDCSGLTYYVYKQFGYTLSRSASGQASNGREVAKSDLQPGDLVIFKNHALTKIGHVGIYIGNNKMIHASEPKTGVIITDIDSKAYKYPQRYYTARRIIN